MIELKIAETLNTQQQEFIFVLMRKLFDFSRLVKKRIKLQKNDKLFWQAEVCQDKRGYQLFLNVEVQLITDGRLAAKFSNFRIHRIQVSLLDENQRFTNSGKKKLARKIVNHLTTERTD